MKQKRIFMKHTDFGSKLHELKKNIVKELTTAIKAHGGEYEVSDGQENHTISCLLTEDIGECFIQTARWNELNGLTFVLEPTSNEICNNIGGAFDVAAEQLLTDDLIAILNWIDCTDEVNDVTEPLTNFPIGNVCREDLEDYDLIPHGRTISDNEMWRIANRMCDSYLNNGYSEDLREAAAHVLGRY